MLALQVGVLVNNVGVSYPHAEYYEAIDDQLIDDLVNINIQATNKARPVTATLHHGHFGRAARWVMSAGCSAENSLWLVLLVISSIRATICGLIEAVSAQYSAVVVPLHESSSHRVRSGNIQSAKSSAPGADDAAGPAGHEGAAARRHREHWQRGRHRRPVWAAVCCVRRHQGEQRGLHMAELLGSRSTEVYQHALAMQRCAYA